MKRLFFVAAAIMAAVVSARAEDKPEDWYKPNTWSGGEQGSATVVYRDGRTVERYTVTMDSDGKVNEDDWEYIVNQSLDNPALLTALSALRKALESQVQIAYMGQRLNDLIGSEGITVKGKDPNGNEYTYTISLKKTTEGKFSKDGEGNIQGETDASLSNYADGKTISWTTDGKAHLQLYGKPANAAAGEGKFPMFNGDSLTWVGLKPYFDDKSLEAKTISNAKIKDGGIQLRGWDTHNLGSDFKLGEVLTGDDEDTSSQVLVYNGGYLQYWHLGKLTAGGGHGVDNSSITTNEANGAVSEGNASLYGFVDAIADAGIAETGTKVAIPFVNGESTHLEWGDPFSWFAPSVFKTSESSGKILLNGTSEEGKATVLAITGSSEEEQALVSFGGDGVSIDFGYGPDGQPQTPAAQLHNFDDPSRNGAHTDYGVADILTNQDVQTAGWYLPLRTGNGVLQYAPLDKITGIPSASVDNLSIENTADEGETEPTKLRIKGAKDATKGQLLKMGDNGQVEWGEAPIEPDCEEEVAHLYPIYVTAEDGEDGEESVAKIGLRGWNTYDSPSGIYGVNDGEPYLFRGVEIQSLSFDQDKVEVDGYLDASQGAIPYKTSGGIAWASGSDKLVMLNGTGAPKQISIGNGLENVSNTLRAKAGNNGITVDSSGIKAVASNGLKVGSNGIEIDRDEQTLTIVTSVSYDSSSRTMKYHTKTIKFFGTVEDGTDISVFTATQHSQND